MALLFSLSAMALDGADQEATTKTQELLKSKDARQKTIEKSEDAKKANAHLQGLTGGDEKLSQEIYELSAEIMPTLVEKSGGDSKKMLELMKNPEAFANSWTPEQKEKLKRLAEKLQSAPKKP